MFLRFRLPPNPSLKHTQPGRRLCVPALFNVTDLWSHVPDHWLIIYSTSVFPSLAVSLFKSTKQMRAGSFYPLELTTYFKNWSINLSAQVIVRKLGFNLSFSWVLSLREWYSSSLLFFLSDTLCWQRHKYTTDRLWLCTLLYIQ